MSLRSPAKAKTLALAIGLPLLAAGVLFVLDRRGIINLPLIADKKTGVEVNTDSLPAAKKDISEKQNNNSSNGEGGGVVEDRQGNVSSVPPESQWTKSSDGLITIYEPAKNAVVKGGDSLSGASKLTQVYFRVIDDVSGVISQGSLTVVDGKFSGKFNFDTAGTNGRIDIFNMAGDGTESSNIEIEIRFK